MYGIRGGRNLTEEVLPHLSGYENSKPVRMGNAAYNQKQNDSLGYLMDVIYNYYLFFPANLDEIEEMWKIVWNIVYKSQGVFAILFIREFIFDFSVRVRDIAFRVQKYIFFEQSMR